MSTDEELQHLRSYVSKLIDRYENWMPKDPAVSPLYSAGMMEAFMEVARDLHQCMPQEPGFLFSPVFSGGTAADPLPDETEVKVILISLPTEGKELYEVVKVVRAVTPMSLPDAIQMIRKVGKEPVVVKDHMIRRDAVKIKEAFRKAGATVELV